MVSAEFLKASFEILSENEDILQACSRTCGIEREEARARARDGEGGMEWG